MAGKQPLGLYTLGYLSVLLAPLCWDVLTTKGDLSCEVAMRLTAAQLILDGKAPYVDFFDWVQPTALNLAMLPVLPQKVLHVTFTSERIEFTAQVMILLFTWSSVVGCFYLMRSAYASITESCSLRSEDIDKTCVPLCLALVAFAYFARYQLGEIQYLLVLCLVPWVLLRWLTYGGLAVNKWISRYCGVCIVLACALDVGNLIGPIATEVALIGCFRRFKSPRLDGLLIGTLIVVLSYICLPPQSLKADFEWIVPLRLVSFGFFDETLAKRAASPDQSNIFYAFALVTALYFTGRKPAVITTVLAVGAFSGMFLFLLEDQGFTRQILVLLFFVIALLFLKINEAQLQMASALQRQATILKFKSPFLMLVGVLFSYCVLRVTDVPFWRSTLATQRASSSNDKELVDVSDFIVRNSASGDRVLFLCAYPDASYPTITSLDRVPSGYLLCARPCEIFAQKPDVVSSMQSMREFQQHIVERSKADISGRAPGTVIVQDGPVMKFLVDNGIEAALRENYQELKNHIRFAKKNQQPTEYLGCNNFVGYSRASNTLRETHEH